MIPLLTSEPIHLDGVPDEPAWTQASVVTGLLSEEPDEGRPEPGAATTVRVLYDDHALYFAFEVPGDGSKLAAPLSRRDQTLLDDWVGVLLDTYGDGRRAFAFRVSAAGVQADGVYREEDGDLWQQDLSWDGIWSAEARRVGGGWTAELAIPWRTLHYPRAEQQDWRVIAIRSKPVPFGVYTWPPQSRARAGHLAQAGTLGPLRPPQRGSLHPEVLGSLTASVDATRPLDDPGVPILADANPAFDPGLGLRLDLSSALTFDAALNPDFSQVEADPDQLTANVKFPLYYEEKRPFFLEGGDTFDTPIEVLYTRSIADPLGATKLSGRVGPVATGALVAWDEDPQPSTIGFDYATGESLRTWDAALVDDASALVSVARARFDAGDARSVGLIAADKELGPYRNVVAGVDGAAPLGSASTVQGQLLGASTTFPDGEETGAAWAAQVKNGGAHHALQLDLSHLDPGFRAEAGYLTEVGRTTAKLSGSAKLDRVGPFRQIQPRAQALVRLDPEGELVFGQGGPALRLHLPAGYGQVQALAIRERYLGVDCDAWVVDGFVDVLPAPSVELYFTGSYGALPWYDAPDSASVYVGRSVTGFVEALATIGGRLGVVYDGTVGSFDHDGELVDLTVIQRLKLSYGLSRQWSGRVIGEWNSAGDTLDTSALLAWERDYGTAFYAGYSQSVALETGDVAERAVFVKVGLLWRP